MDILPTEKNFDIKVGRHSSNGGMIRVVRPLYNDHLDSKKKYRIYIGRYTQIGENLNILSASAHTKNVIANNIGALPQDKNVINTYISNYIEEYGDVIIGNDVWIGRDVFIRGGVKIGDGAVIGAKALVLHDVASYAIVGGIPAKPLGEGYRFPKHIRNALLKIKWWDWDESKISANIESFYDINAFIKKWGK